jgi:hypothetical protein
LCGVSPDLIVAKNLFRLVVKETMEGLGTLRGSLGKTSLFLTEPSDRRRTPVRDWGNLLEKYSRSPKTTRKALAGFLLKEGNSLLSPMVGKQTLFLKHLYPEKAFPSLYRHPFPPDSMMGFILDAMKMESPRFPDIEEMLQKCLELSTIRIICEELQTDIHRIIDPEGWGQRNGRVLDELKNISLKPSAVILVVEDEQEGLKEPVHPVARTLMDSMQGRHVALSMRAIGLLPEVGRRLCQRWAIPVTGMKGMAWLSSPLATWTLGALALGFNVVSFPGLPIHGSEKVERFFTETLKKRAGNVYCLEWKENLFEEWPEKV